MTIAVSRAMESVVGDVPLAVRCGDDDELMLNVLRCHLTY